MNYERRIKKKSMGIRLNKVLTELNIGLQTAVDFLKTKTSLGEIKDDANVNTKITDEQYDALVKEFKVLSGQALDEQGRKVDASAEAVGKQVAVRLASLAKPVPPAV